MARLFPNDYGTATLSAGEAAELETLETLRASLPDDYTVFHGVHWANEDRRGSAIGELDFVVVNQAGATLLVEQKAGPLNQKVDPHCLAYADDVEAFAEELEIHPGIVVGRMQHEGLLDHRTSLNHLKTRFRIATTSD